ncbi:ABC-three component system middle component 6 [Deinococcus sp. RIT780]|uniref:ABC-three component system middle component 6 n=1 Tax=Deinococcus sp. RIT780 TaxID=2870472 RepID=UPI001C8A846A|nr:ABC-three component system middle component 6 [Deinococcus sp. RIT780]MBX8464322.1 hypothetical protein [Deinococcus sp. RIT780]
MILPTKYLNIDRSLLNLGAEVMTLLGREKPVSKLWEEFQKTRQGKAIVTYEWFVLTLDLLFCLGYVDYKSGKIVRRAT